VQLLKCLQHDVAWFGETMGKLMFLRFLFKRANNFCDFGD